MRKILIAFVVFFVISCFLAGLAVNKIIRTDEVYAFKSSVNDQISEVQTKYIRSEQYNKDTFQYYRKIAKEIRDVPFNDMVNSFKPLTLEEWYTPEQIKFLRKYD